MRHERTSDFTPREEATLMAALHTDRDEAFEALVRRFTPRLLAVARRLVRDDQEAQDVVQDAFLSAFRAMSTFRGESRLSTWLHRIVVNTALMQLRRRRRHPETPIEALLPTFTADGHHTAGFRPWTVGERALATNEARARVREAIAELPESYRLVLILRDIEELETDAVAALMGMTANAVKVRLHRARQALMTLLTSALGTERLA